MMEDHSKEKTSKVKGRIAAICGSLGHLYEGEYLIEPTCVDGIKDLIRMLKVDDAIHTNRRCMGQINIVENHLIHIIKSAPPDMDDLFSICLRLLVNLTTPTNLLYGENIPQDKIMRQIYLTLVGHDLSYKHAFGDVELWNKICSKLTNLIEIEWTERSADYGLEIERILTLIRNVLQIPTDAEDQKRPSNVTALDRILMALRESQTLELLLLIASKEEEEAYYLNLLEIFFHLLLEQNPRVLARCEGDKTNEEIDQGTLELVRAREEEKYNQKKYANTRNFHSTFIMRGVKTSSNSDLICHKSLDSLKKFTLCDHPGSTSRSKKKKIPVDNLALDITCNSTVQLFLKEFCTEFLNSGFGRFINTVKHRIDSGKSLACDQTHYFWAITFFMRFATEANLDVAIVQSCLNVESFHVIHTNMEMAFEHLTTEKKESPFWIKRIHTILKAYQSLLQAIHWMDSSKNPMVRALSREVKTNVFYVVEYRELTLSLFKQYDPLKFSVSYLRDLIETSHLFVKLLEDFAKQTKLIVQKVAKKRKSKKKKKKGEEKMTEEKRKEKWDKIKEDVYDSLCFQNSFPEIPPFDAALDIPIDDQKERAMKNIQNLLHAGRFKDAIGLLRSSRQVWPENDYFGSSDMSPEEESMALQEICLADLEPLKDSEKGKVPEGNENEEEANNCDNNESEENDEDDYTKITEQEFDIMDYKQRLVNRKVVEICGILLRNYKRNSDHVNHCALKLLHRIGWECNMPAILYQLSLFCTLLMVLNDPNPRYNEIKTFAINLVRRFRKHATDRPVVFVELLFWKTSGVALEIQHGYEQNTEGTKVKSKKKTKRVKGKNKKEKEGVSQFIDNNENFDSDESGDKEKEGEIPVDESAIPTNEISNKPEDSLHSDSNENLPDGFEPKAVDSTGVTGSNSRPGGFSSPSDRDSSDEEEDAIGRVRRLIGKANKFVSPESDNSEVDQPSTTKRRRDESGNLSDSSTEFSPSVEKVSNEEKRSRSKRARFVTSDSDGESVDSEDEPKEKTRRSLRPNVIDSDSDESNDDSTK